VANFKNKRYMTIGVQNEIYPILQIIMWNMIDKEIRKGQEMDYLQVFKLAPANVNDKLHQEIIHSQEVPERENKVTLKIDNVPITAKIFVIDSDEYVTMLLSNEY